MSEVPPKKTTLFEVLRDKEPGSQDFEIKTHMSRGAAVKMKLEDNTVDQLEKGLSLIDSTKKAKEKNEIFYTYLEKNTTGFVDKIRKPNEV